MCGSILQKVLSCFLHIIFISTAFLVATGHAFEAAEINETRNYWEERRVMMKDGKIKRIADQCQSYTQRHSTMAGRASGWLYNHVVGFGGDNGFIDRPTHAYEEREIVKIHKWLTDENRWERHGSAVPGALERCHQNMLTAQKRVVNIMEKFGARYDVNKNDWVDDF